jgi:chemotaxis protein MotB
MAKKGAHHGGAWKVAYADFVTAMMALFMVLWICAQDKKILIATSKYFKQPFNSLTKSSVGVIDKKETGATGKDQNTNTPTAVNLAFLNALAGDLSRMINTSDISDEKNAEMQLTSDGLKITLYDRNNHPMFKPGTSETTEWGQLTLQNLAWIIDHNNLKVYIDGHTAEVTSPAPNAPDPWDLTTDRANTARRLLVKYAVNPNKIVRVTGFAAADPLPNRPPNDSANERLTISLSVSR